jgi:hypothetical protein
VELHYDLFEGLPYFTEGATAEKAEAVLANIIDAQLDGGVVGGGLKGRRKLRAKAAASKRKTVKKPAPKSSS